MAAYSTEVLADSPLAYWRMGEGAGAGTMQDDSGNARTGSYQGGGHVFGVTGLLTGDPNTAINFNGSSSRADASNAAWMDVGTITVEAWVKPDVTPAALFAIAFRDEGNFTAGNTRSFQFAIPATTGRPYLSLWGSVGGVQTTAQATTGITAGVRAHVVGTYDGTNIKMYVNGALEATTALTGSLPTGSGSIVIGRNSSASNSFFDGVLDEVAIYSGALSAARILAHYTAGITDPTPVLTGDLTGTGTMTADVSAIHTVTGALTGTGTMSATVDSEVEVGPTPPKPGPPGRIPLRIRAGSRDITRQVSGLQFRKEAVGGLKSINLRLAHPLDRFDENLAPLSEVIVSDGRTTEIVAQGRLTDPGRSATASDGQQWDMVAFPPSLDDQTFPYIPITTSLEPFTRSKYATKNATDSSDEHDTDEPSLVLAAEEGKTVTTSWTGDMINRSIREAGMKLGRVRARVDCGVTSANFDVQLITRDGATFDATAATANADTTAAILAGVVVTDFTNGADVVSIRAVRNTSGTTGTEDQWFEFWEFCARALLLDATGAEITTGYTVNYVLAHEVINDLLGRVLDQIDGTNSVVSTGGTYQVDQMDYRDGVNADQVLTDLMALEPAYRWWVDVNPLGTSYIFHWEAWPTSVRYEITLNGGGDFPSSSRELYNKVVVRWRGPAGRTRTLTRTSTCQILDDRGQTRSTIIDAGDEIGSATGAARLGDNFLAEHNVPANAGTIIIDRPIRDMLTGRIVDPHQIQEAALIRVRGLESYQDALNPNSRDGLTVFRIWSVTYNSDAAASACELDIPSRSTTNALRSLSRRAPLGAGRPRKR